MSVEVVFSSDENNPDELLKEFFSRNDYFTAEEKSDIKEAWNFLIEKSNGQLRACGSPYYLHPLRIANILAQNKLDSNTIQAALLHSIYNLNVTSDDIKKKFGENVSKIIDGTAKIMNVSSTTKTIYQSDAVRKMLLAMVDDVRIILVKLADRLDRIRHIKSLEKKEQKVLAEEIIDIWAPLADRLGMQTEKNEFEDLSLKYKNPAVFQQIKAIISQKKDERKNYLEKAVNQIKESALKEGIEVTITSRAKHFYSIYQKMRKRNKEAGELFDLLALRVLCNTTTECYTLIGIVHSLWKPLEGRFKDYIAIPKSNGYQSLHTTVMCDDKPLEIQIRTYEMHNMAEHGIASHWLYKKGTNKDLVEADKLDIFNKLQKLKETSLTDESSFQTLKNELLGDEIYVFTPKGDVRKLPAGSTAIDFAYAIHSAIGEKIVGAKADGKIIPLSTSLKNTQIIEILTNPQAHPTEAQLKLVKTSKAHQKIHSWLMTNEPSFSDTLNMPKPEAEEKPLVKQRKKRAKAGEVHVDSFNPNRKVKIDGSINYVFTFAKCCKPKYPEPIVGYISSQRGVSVHRADCLVYQNNQNKKRRSVDVAWDEEKKN